MDSRRARTQIYWRDERRQQYNATSLSCTVFLKVLAVSELIRGCYAYQASLPNSFSNVQQRTQQPTWQQPYYHQSHQPLNMARKRRPLVEPYDDIYEEEDDDYWPEAKAEKQETPAQDRRPLGFAPDSAATVNREKRIQSNPNMDFRNVEENPLNDPIQRYNGNARRLRNTREFDSYYYDDDDDDEEDDGYYYDDDDDEEEEDNNDAGNFWSNPPARFDSIQQPKRRVPRDNEPAPARASRSRRPPRSSSINERRPGARRKKSTFRSGIPKPPAVVEDIYNQLFWYGFDPADTTSPADKTMFGGTKGKFNGLAFLDNTLDPIPPMMMENRSGPRQRKNRQQRDQYYDDDDYYDDYDEPDNRSGEEETFSDTLERISRQDKPARSARSSNYDDDDDRLYSDQRPPPSKRIRMDDMKASAKPPERRKRRPRQSPWEEEDSGRNFRRRRRRNNQEDEDDSLQWASKKVASWFRDDEDEDDNEIESRRRSGGMERQRRGRRRKSEQASWVSPFEVVGKFFGIDDEDFSYQAAMYNRQMGLGPQREKNGRIRNGSRRPERRGTGYAYHYDVDTSEYDTIVDADIVETDGGDTETKSQTTLDTQEVEIEASVVDSTNKEFPTASTTTVKDNQAKSPKKANWEERALAIERIPPPDIPAWGPSGDLGMDARMKATIDALQDIQEAQNKLEQRKKREQQATDDITILKVDVGVKKRRMAANRQEARMLREDIRNLELDIEDASRTLRKARDQVQFAQSRLTELEDRHWALIGLYDPDQAEEKVEEALQEFAAKEPAVRGRVTDAASSPSVHISVVSDF